MIIHGMKFSTCDNQWRMMNGRRGDEMIHERYLRNCIVCDYITEGTPYNNE